MPSVGFEPAIPASERSQTHGFDRVAIGIGHFKYLSMDFDDISYSGFTLNLQ
jgi:hypothetical protein